MYLFVQPSGVRSWIQRLVIRNRRRELRLDSLALVRLAEAREKALANRKLTRLARISQCAMERRLLPTGAKPVQQLSLRLVATRADHGGNDMV